jgi:hypothetical protein
MDDPLSDLRRAILDKGPRPDVHDEIMTRHRREWPTLWRAIDRLVAGSATPTPLGIVPQSGVVEIDNEQAQALLSDALSAVAGSATPTRRTAHGDPGPPPFVGPATPTDWEEEGRKAAAEGLTPDQAAERFGELVAGSVTPTEPRSDTELRTAAEALQRLETPFSAYERWRKNGNTADADKLQVWDDARVALSRALVAGSAAPTGDDDE